MARIVILVGHARKETYGEALAESYACGARLAGHEVQLFVLSKLAFDPILHEGFSRPQPLEPDLEKVHGALVAADHLVIVFPLWMGNMPAILNGFIERIFQPEYCEAERRKQSFPQPLKGKSGLIVMTMGMPALAYRCWYGPHALRILRNFVLWHIGVHPTRVQLIGRVEAIGHRGRSHWLNRMEELGRRAA
ncbi:MULTISPECIES: NAD(P)H-dependent oxidoreductase [Acidobacterium]|uniref:Flavodoxin-like fold protein n=1 Tax=Acidobacterium capsulatum (strain ATCC 51196 / DSM 11244 / BCRC 80197 / JCM 7670 / NBRC 15755 / NCIMB 13165 / 161) TaxID=240015 RepID=C1F6Z2_ACIC5|nr:MULTISPECIES: NAD(P)H-dependent oxidoreductase [Acidobacterium]ACO31699.1 Flavodoxin-like fold protein [Acidobacterium capsulatum ATCC 51196]HCT59442.1 flavodoxin [Acidobacterium sp.]